MLMQMMSAGAMGGGISSAVARALGAGRRADADALASHALVIGVVFGLGFTLAVLGGGPWLYAAMGGRGASLAAALTCSNVIFSAAVMVWLFNSLANVIRGSGSVLVPAIVTSAGALVLIPLSPCLIFGWGPFPRLGVAGGAVAVVVYYLVGTIALMLYLRSRRSVVHLSAGVLTLRWALFRDILRVGLFNTDPAMLDAGLRYLHAVGPFYGFGLGMALYFASQGAGQVLWALLANLARLAIATIGGWLALHSSSNLSHVFLAMSAALTMFGLINAAAVAGGAWFGPIRWPVLRRAYAVVRD
jgi:Na+-driven multidrug efflux pump